MEKKEYYLGLDMGTNSVGWAVTDKEYNLLRAKGKDLWGIREFDEAKTAAERRTHRTSRRRRQREIARRGMVRMYFDEAISSIDPYFFQRLDNSKYYVEDKDEPVRYMNGIFNDDNYTDKDYFKEYPTIFHLRCELIKNKEPHDVRLVYLAVANLFKRRGHFLNTGLDSNSNRKIDEIYREFSVKFLEYIEKNSFDMSMAFPENIDVDVLEEILSKRDVSRTEKAERIQALISNGKKDKRQTVFIKMLCGLKVDASVLFAELELDEKCSICFSDYDYDEKVPQIQEVIGEDNYALVALLKEMNDIGTLAGIMKGYNYISESRVASYEKHKKDLQILKKLVRKYAANKVYDKLFRSVEDGTYSAYVNSANAYDNKFRRNMDSKKRKADEFYKTVKGVLQKFPKDDKDVAYIAREIETETFLPKQLTATNGVIPNQIHKKELDAILENASTYLDFLNDVDESGLSVKERISKLYSFKVPYYVGPVTSRSATDGGNGWVVRKEDGQVLPWNIEEKIDMGRTSEKFIERLIRDCTYINGEKVMPKASLKYERYCVLNEINNIRIDGEKISVELKQEIFKSLFENGKKVTRKKLFNFLYTKGLIEEDNQLSGIDKTINSSLSSFGKFTTMFGDKMREDTYIKMVEDIVFWCTVYGDEKKILRTNLKKYYGKILSDSEIKRICGFKFKDWGRFSNEFLNLQGIYKPTGEITTIIKALWEDENNSNLMELINSNLYTFAEELDKKKNKCVKTLKEFTYDDLEDTYFSAPVKRMVWQTIKIMKELEQVLCAPPSRIFVEMTRSEDEKGESGRKSSRKNHLQKLYKSIQGESAAWKKEMNNQIDKADENGLLRSKKMYLYFTQMGRCMYTGKTIELDDLFNNNIYDIDHIYPRHFVKDDSLNNNLVLVKKETNAFKSDVYPINSNIRNNADVRGLWLKLKECNLITEEKYRRLTSSTPFTDEQKAGFIARQFVETSQGTKGVAEILKQILPEESEIVYVKARNVSDFRHENELLKSRLINDFHHANDAYLNIVVGNAYYVKFTKNPLNYIRKEYNQDRSKYNYNLGSMFRYDIKRGDEVGWIAAKEGNPGTIATVKRVMARNTPLLTRMNFEATGKIANDTLYGKAKAKPDVYIPLKSSDSKMQDVNKYGGYTSVSTAYFFLVEHGKENKRIRTLETLPVYMKRIVEKSDEALVEYCENELKLISPSIRKKKIRIQSLVRRNGYYMHLSGKTLDQITLRNAVSVCLNQKWINYVHDIEKSATKESIKDSINRSMNNELYNELLQKHQNTIFSKKPNPVGEILEKCQKNFEKLSLYEQVNTLKQVMQLSAIGTVGSDLKLIGGSAKTGTIKISKTISKADEFVLIEQSVTGLLHKEIDLLTV